MNDLAIVQLLSCLSTTYSDSSWSVDQFAIRLEDCPLRKSVKPFSVSFYFTEKSNKFLLCIMSTRQRSSKEFVGTIEQVVKEFDNWSVVYRL